MKYVYLLRVGENHYKVGVSTNVKSRVSTLQNSNPKPISVVTTRLVNDAYRVEKDIHEFLSDRHVGDGREWFELTPAEALDMAIIINKNPEIDMTQQITVRTILAQHAAHQKTIESKLEFVMTQYAKLIKQKGAEPFKLPDSPKPDPAMPDELLMEKALEVFRRHGNKASTSLLQRELHIGYGRAARCLDQLANAGMVSQPDGPHARKLLKDAV